MTQAELRKYIVTILLDVRGDNEYPEDNVLQANASMLLGKVMYYVDEMIGEDETEDPAHVSNQLKPYLREKQLYRNELRLEQRKRAELRQQR